MFYDDARSHRFDTPESGPRFRIMVAEIWHDWLEAMSEVAYQTHKACEFLAENGDPSSPFDSHHWRGPSEWPNGLIDMDKLKECLQSMDPMQAARVMHAVQMMQVMEAMRRRPRANEEEGAAW